MLTTRQRAAALLDVLRHREDGDRTADAVRRACRYRAALASKAYPEDALLWAWADVPSRERRDAARARGEAVVLQPGELDMSRTLLERVDGKQVSVRTPFGVLFDWIRDRTLPRGTLVLAGGTGCGKGVTAAYAAVHLGGLFVSAAGVSELPLSGSAELTRLERADLLVLDELGRESAVGKTRERLIALLQQRHDARRCTIVATNIASKREFGRTYGDHLLDRVDKSGGYHELTGSSRRCTVDPKLTSIERDCLIADLVAEVDSLTGALREGADRKPIDTLAAMFDVGEAELEAAAERSARAREQVLASARMSDLLASLVQRVVPETPASVTEAEDADVEEVVHG